MLIESPEICRAPKVSVAMISYNHAAYIAQAVESALNQETSFPFEVVVGDDVSTDGTREILLGLQKRYPDRLRLLFHEKNLGNMGKPNFMAVFNACRGEYFAFLDGDDYWNSRGKLQMQVDALEQNPDWSAHSHGTMILRGEKEVGPACTSIPAGVTELTPRELIRYEFPHSMTLMIRRRAFPGLPPWFLDVCMGDWTLYLMASQGGRIGYAHGQHLGTYRLHEASFWVTRKLIDRNRDEIYALKLFRDHLKGGFNAEFSQQLNRREFWETDAHCELSDFPEARRAYWKAMRGWPRHRGVSWDWIIRYFVRSHLPVVDRWRRSRKGNPK